MLCDAITEWERMIFLDQDQDQDSTCCNQAGPGSGYRSSVSDQDRIWIHKFATSDTSADNA